MNVVNVFNFKSVSRGARLWFVRFCLSLSPNEEIQFFELLVSPKSWKFVMDLSEFSKGLSSRP